MRTITDHHDGHGLAESITIEATDELGPGGASHVYRLTLPGGPLVGFVQFQRGPRDAPESTSGIIDSALLAIVVDRMRSFQAGPYPSREGALVRTKCEEALHWLRHRADERAARGVLGRDAK